MGSFMGHVLPGSFFCLFPVWWIYNIFRRFHLCRRTLTVGEGGSSTTYRNTCTFTCSCCPSLPLEGFIKVVSVIIGMTGEFITAFKHGEFVHLGNAQHMTMFFFFGLNGAVDILTHYRAPLPQDLDYITACLAFCMEGLLFLYHLHGRTPMDVQIHTLLLYVISGCIVSTLLEMYHKRSVLAALARTYFTLLQGTWFLQAGFILYPPVGKHWAEENHDQMMIVTLIFCWHNALVFIVMAFFCFLIHFRVKALSPTSVYHQLHPLTRPQNRQLTKLNAEQVQHIIADSEEEDV